MLSEHLSTCGSRDKHLDAQEGGDMTWVLHTPSSTVSDFTSSGPQIFLNVQLLTEIFQGAFDIASSGAWGLDRSHEPVARFSRAL